MYVYRDMKNSECTKDSKMAQATKNDAETIARHLAESLDGTLTLEPQEMKQLRREWNAARARVQSRTVGRQAGEELEGRHGGGSCEAKKKRIYFQ